jgi:hypothetical protein
VLGEVYFGVLSLWVLIAGFVGVGFRVFRLYTATWFVLSVTLFSVLLVQRLVFNKILLIQKKKKNMRAIRGLIEQPSKRSYYPTNMSELNWVIYWIWIFFIEIFLKFFQVKSLPSNIREKVIIKL